MPKQTNCAMLAGLGKSEASGSKADKDALPTAAPSGSGGSSQQGPGNAEQQAKAARKAAHPDRPIYQPRPAQTQTGADNEQGWCCAHSHTVSVTDRSPSQLLRIVHIELMRLHRY